MGDPTPPIGRLPDEGRKSISVDVEVSCDQDWENP